MNKNILLSCGSLFCGLLALPTFSVASPLVSVGDNVDIFFNGSSSVTWDSNIFRDSSDEIDDLILKVSPGFDINVGRGLSNADLSIFTRYNIVRYEDQSQLDTELFNIQIVGNYESGRLDLSGNFGYQEVKGSTGDSATSIDDLIEWDDTTAGVSAEYRFSSKLSLGVGVDYKDRVYNTYEDVFADREVVKLPVDVYYELTPKVDLSVGYAYSDVEIGDTALISDYTYDTHFLNVGARGVLLPKLTGFFKVGYRDRNTDSSTVDDTSMFGLESNFTWVARPKVTVKLDLSRDFDVGSEGGTTEVSSVNSSVSYSINTNWSAAANAGYTLRDYDNGREDDQYKLGLNVSYALNTNLRFGGGYNYIENNSSEDDRTYESHMLNLSVSLRY